MGHRRGRTSALAIIAVALIVTAAFPIGASFSNQASTRLYTHAYASVLDASGAYVLVNEWSGVINDPEGAYPASCSVILLEPASGGRLVLASLTAKSCVDLSGDIEGPRMAYPAADGLRVFNVSSGQTLLIGAGLTEPALDGARVAAYDAAAGRVRLYPVAASPAPLLDLEGRPLSLSGNTLALMRPATGTFSALILRNLTSGFERLIPENNAPYRAQLAGGRIAYASVATPFTTGGPVRIATEAGTSTLIGHPGVVYSTLSFDGVRVLVTRLMTREALLLNENGSARSLGQGEALGFFGSTAAWVDRDAGVGVALDKVDFFGENNPPTATVVASAPAVAGGWRKGPLTLSFNASDDAGGSGVAGVMTWVRASPAPRGELRPVMFETYGLYENGDYDLTFWAVDANGNEQRMFNASYKVDSTPPSLSFTVVPYAPPGFQGWFRQPINVVGSALDVGSGVATYGIRANGGPYAGFVHLAQEGLYALDGFVEDAVGHRATKSAAYGIDYTPPTSQHVLSSGTRHSSGWFTTPVTFTYESFDDLSGPYLMYASVDGGPNKLVLSSTTIATEGAHTVAYFARDKALNDEAPHAMEFKIDLNPPTVDLLAPERGQVWHGGAEVISLGSGPVLASGRVLASASATDSASGVARIVFRVDGVERAEGATWSWNTATEALGSHILEVVAYDVVGRASVAKRVEVYVLPEV